jgi:proliferating cell nuclear antigen
MTGTDTASVSAAAAAAAPADEVWDTVTDIVADRVTDTVVQEVTATTGSCSSFDAAVAVPVAAPAAVSAPIKAVKAKAKTAVPKTPSAAKVVKPAGEKKKPAERKKKVVAPALPAGTAQEAMAGAAQAGVAPVDSAAAAETTGATALPAVQDANGAAAAVTVPAAAPLKSGSSNKRKMAAAAAQEHTSTNNNNNSGSNDLASALKAKKSKRAATGPVTAAAAPAAAAPAASQQQDHPSPCTTGTTGEGEIVPDPVHQADVATFGKKEELDSNVIMCMRTLQAAQWRTLIDTLKDLVPTCPVEFDAKGMRLVSMDPGHVAMIHLQAMSEFYYCKAPISIGLNLMALYKMLRNLTTAGYMLEFSLTSDNPEHLMIVITNGDKKTVTRHMLKLMMRLDEDCYEIPTATFHRVLSIPSTDFQRYIRELSTVSKRITIRSTKNILELSATGRDGSTTTEIKPTPSGMHWTHIQPVEQGGDEVISGVFFSKYLERFARPLDNVVEIFIKQDYPLVIKYVMPTAIVRLVIGQIAETGEEGAEDDMDYDN